MAATDLERFSVRALLGRGARGRRGALGGGRPAAGRGRQAGCQLRAAGPRRRAGLGTPERALRSASLGSRGVGGGAPLGRTRGRPPSREGANKYLAASGQVRGQTGAPGARGVCVGGRILDPPDPHTRRVFLHCWGDS